MEYQPDSTSAEVVRSTLRQRRTAWSREHVYRRDASGLQHFKSMVMFTAANVVTKASSPDVVPAVAGRHTSADVAISRDSDV